MTQHRNTDHGYADSDLISGARLAAILGVSRQAVSQAMKTESGRLDQWETTTGEWRFHPKLSAAQWTQRRAANYVTTPTQAQARAGTGNMAAQAVAHRGVTNPARRAETRSPDEGSGIDQDRHTLAMSRADRERLNAQLLEIKVREKTGDLVDKAIFYQKAYALTAAVRDQLDGLPGQIGPEIVSHVEEALVQAGLAPELVRSALDRGGIQHRAREALRLGIVRALRTLSSKPVQELLA